MKDYVSDCLVRDLANRDPRIRQVLEQLGIDTCCGGGRNLYDAMREAGITGDQLNRSIELAMQEGWSTAPDYIRQMGFGAGMGLPNMMKCSDKFDIQSKIGEGTSITMEFKHISEDL